MIVAHNCTICRLSNCLGMNCVIFESTIRKNCVIMEPNWVCLISGRKASSPPELLVNQKLTRSPKSDYEGGGTNIHAQANKTL